MASTAQQWKKSRGGVDLTVPSGQTCHARPVNLDVFLKTGRIPNTLRSMIDQAKAGKEIDNEEVLEKLFNDGDPKVFNDMIKLVDMVVCDCVIEPKVHRIPLTDEVDEDGDKIPVPFSERDQEILYVDEIDLTDRMFIFNFAVSGVTDLETFRERSEGNVEGVRALAGDGSSS